MTDEVKKTPQKVYFLDNSYKIVMVSANAKCESICKEVGEKLGFQNPADDSYWFSLYESLDGVTLNRALPKDMEIETVIQSWEKTGQSKLVFKIKLFMDALVKSKDPAIQYMRFIQACYNVNNGNYPIKHVQAVELACYQFIKKFGNQFYDFSQEDFDQFLKSREIEYFPKVHRDTVREIKDGKTNAFHMCQFKEKMLEKGTTLTNAQAVAQYIRIVATFPSYGCAFFPVTQYNFQMPQDVLIGVHSKGFMLFVPGKTEYFHIYQLQDCLRWGYVPTSTFYIAVKNENGKNIIFGSSHGPAICDAMTSYAYGWLKHAAIMKEKYKQAGKDGSPAAADLIRRSNDNEVDPEDELDTTAVEVQVQEKPLDEPDDSEKEMVIPSNVMKEGIQVENEEEEEGTEEALITEVPSTEEPLEGEVEPVVEKSASDVTEEAVAEPPVVA